MPSAKILKPASETTLFIEFDNGEQFQVPYLDIRFACPCASCVDEMTGKRTLNKSILRADVKPRKVEPVGRYAIQFQWSDGHSTGMYPLDRLYDIAQKSGFIVGQSIQS